METFLEENPDAAKNLLFEDKQFKSYLDAEILNVDELTPDQYNAAIEDLKQKEIDYNTVLLEGYKKMINNTFENSLVPVPERVSTKKKNVVRKDAPLAGRTLTTLDGKEMLVDEIKLNFVDDITKVKNAQPDQYYRQLGLYSETGGKIYQADKEGKLIELKIKEPVDTSKL
jgi:hypothetical protein